MFFYICGLYISFCIYTRIYIYRLATMVNPNGKRIYDPVFRPRGPPPSPPNGMGPQVAPPLPFYLQAIGSISEVQPRIC